MLPPNCWVSELYLCSWHLAVDSGFIGSGHWLLSYLTSNYLGFDLKKTTASHLPGEILILLWPSCVSWLTLELGSSLECIFWPPLSTYSLAHCSWLCSCLCQCPRPLLTWDWLAFLLVLVIIVYQGLSYMEGPRMLSYHTLPWMTILEWYLKWVLGEKRDCFIHVPLLCTVGHSQSILLNQVNFYKTPTLKQMVCWRLGMAVVGSGVDGKMGKAVPAFSGFVSISQTSCPATS